jgi:membrane-associated phospholipid phosphatase
VVTGDRLTVLDVVIANWFHAHATPAMTTLMLAVSNLHGPVGGGMLGLAACLMVALVGLSRMYLGVHYLSDVLAASAEGCAWLAICITALSTLRRRREGRSLIN